ncbi:DUF1622 domain-containing protein [Agathobaculum sp. Marseille-P7918]|uniref:DUF1622 domain-containing protein n=1 Tax=Agathobaculum sp. Marseille-P7918 TaxID=2479843 RepID=UPI000F634CF1|nr:DUF1622 domain-containing protein [Agathobaculum sp. Marseille-P7918]
MAEHVLTFAVSWAILLFEYVGVAVIAVAGAQGVWHYVRRDPLTRLTLAKGLAMGLEFKLGSEILRTVIVRELREIALVGAIIVLRAALTVLIHWEIKNEEQAAETLPQA